MVGGANITGGANLQLALGQTLILRLRYPSLPYLWVIGKSRRWLTSRYQIKSVSVGSYYIKHLHRVVS